MSNHTPGPWKADGYSIRQASTGTRHVAEIAYTGPHHTPPEEYPKGCRLQDEANARLIAAATELLAACEWAREQIGKHTRPSPLDAAIAKALNRETP